jgi:hypothetical protein
LCWEQVENLKDLLIVWAFYLYARPYVVFRLTCLFTLFSVKELC